MLVEHADHQVDVDVELVDRRIFDLPAFLDEPFGGLARGHLLRAVVGVADECEAIADDVEVAALEVAGRDHVVDRDIVLEIEAQHGGIFAAAARVGELADHGAIGRHEGRVARIDLVGVGHVERQEMRGDARLMVGIHHLAVLAHGQLLVELVALAHRVAHQRRPRRILQPHPAEAFGGAQQHVLQEAGFGPNLEAALHAGRAAILEAGAKRGGGGRHHVPHCFLRGLWHRRTGLTSLRRKG